MGQVSQATDNLLHTMRTVFFLNKLDDISVAGLIRALGRLQQQGRGLIRSTGKAFAVPTRNWGPKEIQYFGRKPIFVHPVFSLDNKIGRMVECISLKDARVTDEETIKKILAVLAHLTNEQWKRTKQWEDPSKLKHCHYGPSCKRDYTALCEAFGNLNMNDLNLFDPATGTELTDEQVLVPGAMPDGSTHALNTLLRSTAGPGGMRQQYAEHMGWDNESNWAEDGSVAWENEGPPWTGPTEQWDPNYQKEWTDDASWEKWVLNGGDGEKKEDEQKPAEQPPADPAQETDEEEGWEGSQQAPDPNKDANEEETGEA